MRARTLRDPHPGRRELIWPREDFEVPRRGMFYTVELKQQFTGPSPISTLHRVGISPIFWGDLMVWQRSANLNLAALFRGDLGKAKRQHTILEFCIDAVRIKGLGQSQRTRHRAAVSLATNHGFITGFAR